MQGTKVGLDPWARRVCAGLVLSLMGVCACDSGHPGPAGTYHQGPHDAAPGSTGAQVPPHDASSDGQDASTRAPEDTGGIPAEVDGGDRVVTSTELAGTVAVPPECSLPADCVPIETPVFSAPACPRENTSCGYVISTTQQTLVDYAGTGVEDFFDTIWDDGCVPRSFMFNTQPGIDSYRVPLEGEDDILIGKQCEYRTFWAFPMPGCCMPNNQCGVSTDEIFGTLQVLFEGGAAPFTEPECVSAAELNQQFRDSGSLASLAFIPDTTGTCDYAALDEELRLAE